MRLINRGKYYKDNPEAVRLRDIRNNPRRNGISRIAYRMAGGTTQFYCLPRKRRLELRQIATDLYDSGQDFGIAQQREKTDKRGFVYLIGNPAWPGLLKIGRAFDPESRLAGYQTGSPFRDYELFYSVYFDDCYQAEKDVHLALADYHVTGEWFDVTKYQAKSLLIAMKEATYVGKDNCHSDRSDGRELPELQAGEDSAEG